MDGIQQVKEYFDARAAQWDQMCHHDPEKLAALVTLAGVRPGDFPASSLRPGATPG